VFFFYYEGWNTIEHFKLGYLNQGQCAMRMELLLSCFLIYQACHQHYLVSKLIHELSKCREWNLGCQLTNCQKNHGNLWKELRALDHKDGKPLCDSHSDKFQVLFEI
jgi:hypothetical protein